MAETTEMLEAVKSGDVPRVKKLLSAEPGLVNARAESGESAFLLSLYYGHAAVKELLLSSGAELNVYEAAAAGELERVKSLIAASTNLLASFSHDGFAPLHLAAFFGQKAVVDYLLSRGAAVNEISRNPSALRPIHSAVAHRHPETALAITRALIAAGAEVNVTQQAGWTPLHSAALHGYLPLVKVLLEAGADTAARADNGQTSQTLAASKNHKEVIALLRQHGAKP